MRKLLFLIAVFTIAAANVFAQSTAAGFDLSNYGVRVEPDKRVMVVLAALDSARTEDANGKEVRSLNTELAPEGTEFRELLSSDLTQMPADLRRKISSFVNLYKERNPKLSDSEIIAPFISMAYALTPAPELADPIVTSSLPGNLLNVLDFAPLVREFYRRTSISQNIDEYVKTYRKAADGKLRNSTKEMVNDLLMYLHTRPILYFDEAVKIESNRAKKSAIKGTETRSRERHFYLVPEMLAPKNTVIFLNIRDDYYVIVSPDTDLTFSDVRRGYLQFVIDPLILKSSKDIEVIRDSVKKMLDERRLTHPDQSPDIFLVLSRSLVAAIDIKQKEAAKIDITTIQARRRIEQEKTVDDKKKVSAELDRLKKEFADESILQMTEEYEKGNVFVFYFADRLKGSQDSGFDIASSLRDMILSVDPGKETARVAENAEASKRALAVREERKTNPPSTIIAENPVTEGLLAIQKTIDTKDYAAAETALKELLEKHPGEPRIYYSLGRVESLSAQSIEDEEQLKAKLLDSKVAYENVIRIAQKQKVDLALLSLTYVALAKIYEFYGDKATTLALYEKAIAIGPVTRGAFQEAMDAKARLIKEK